MGEVSPKRIQRKRTRGWRMPENTVSVTRPGKWGNPFRVVWCGTGWTVVDDNGVDYRQPPNGWQRKEDAQRKAVHLFQMDINLGLVPPVSELRGKDLACWCGLSQWCHGDLLLDLTNRGAQDG